MTASELFEAGELRKALAAQLAAVRAAPADADARRLLAALLAFEGRLTAAFLADADLAPTAAAERHRRRVYARGEPPDFLGEPSEAVLLRFQAAERLLAGRLKGALGRLDRADALARPLPIELNGQRVETLRDTDDVLGTVLEVFVGGRCCWVGFESVERLVVDPPAGPLDGLWARATLTVRGEAARPVRLPLVYAGSHAHPEPLVRLGRETDWESDGGGPVRGVGGKVLLTDDGEFPLADLRHLLVGPGRP